jgi:hypothetical protein
MWRPEELRDVTRRQPFRPFRIHVSDQSHYDVVHPDLMMIGERSIVIGIPGRRPGVYARTVYVALADIVRIDPDLTAPSP